MPHTTTEAPPQKTRHTILVVEDEELIRISTSEFLREYGFTVLEAGDVAEAETLLGRSPIDLVFSDVNLPNRQTGFALEKWIRRHYPSVGVILTSGHPQDPDDINGLQEPLLLKPYTYSALLRRIDRMLEAATA
jgi:DNA-binding response OmpR family regulator